MTNRVLRWSWLLVVLAAGTGCGRMNSVSGKVTFDDGAPVPGGLVVFESKDQEPAITARAEIQPDGSYRLGTHKPGDGAPAGVYRVLIAPPPPEDPRDRFAPPPFEERYTDFRTSGLEFEVKSGSNELPIQLKRNPKVKGRR
jgi:hypothetical protein